MKTKNHKQRADLNINLKDQVRDFWNKASCGEVYAQGDDRGDQLDAHAHARYTLEPYIAEHAIFVDGRDKDVLEIGVGMGADHLRWALSKPNSLTGIDLTPRAIEHTRERLRIARLTSDLRVATPKIFPSTMTHSTSSIRGELCTTRQTPPRLYVKPTACCVLVANCGQ